MIKLFKNLTKKDVCFILVAILLIVFQVRLDLKLPDYMSEITRLVQTTGRMEDICYCVHLEACYLPFLLVI